MRVRGAVDADLGAVLGLVRTDVVRTTPGARPEPVAVTDRQRRAMTEIEADPHAEVLVGELHGPVVATCQLNWLRHLTHDGGQICQIEAVWVDEAQRGRGLGAELMRHVLAEPPPRLRMGTAQHEHAATRRPPLLPTARLRGIARRHEAVSHCGGVMRLHHVQLSCPVGGEDVARRFWGAGLGLPEVAKPPALAARGGVWFRGEGVEVHVGVEEPFWPARKAHPALLVDDPDAVAARLAALGCPVRWDGALPGYRRFYTADGHGNRIELLAPG